jgi:hypothetical protein
MKTILLANIMTNITWPQAFVEIAVIAAIAFVLYTIFNNNEP